MTTPILPSAWMLRRLLRHAVIVHRRAEGPPDGDGVPTITVTQTATTGYAEQANAGEPATDPAWPTADWRIILAAADGLDLDGWDRVDVGATAFEVTGGPWPVYEPHSDLVHHIELRARRAEANT